MQDLVKQIVEMDKKARAITDSAQKEKIDSQKKIQEERERIRTNYLQEARRRIAKNEPAERAAAEAAWEKQKARNAADAEKLETLYRENGDRWVSEIVKRVTGE